MANDKCENYFVNITDERVLNVFNSTMRISINWYKVYKYETQWFSYLNECQYLFIDILLEVNMSLSVLTTKTIMYWKKKHQNNSNNVYKLV